MKRDSSLKLVDKAAPLAWPVAAADQQFPYAYPLEVSDDLRLFALYVLELEAAGLFINSASLNRAIQRDVLRLDGVGTISPQLLGSWLHWTEDQRRIVVAMTWPSFLGGVAFIDQDADQYIEEYLVGRDYTQIFKSVRDAMKNHLRRLRNVVDGNPLREGKRLGIFNLVDDPEALISDELPGGQSEVPLFTLQTIIDVAEALELGFTNEFDPEGGWVCDTGRLKAKFAAARGFKHEVEAAVANLALKRKQLADAINSGTLRSPDFLHEIFTAGGIIQPPNVESKYFKLWEALDNSPEMDVVLGREELANLLNKSEQSRSIRGSHGHAGIPKAAVTSTWWYGPWNPDRQEQPPSEFDRNLLFTRMQSKAHTRAWLAAGRTASPKIKRGELVSVRFRAVSGREAWWPHRLELRAGKYVAERSLNSSDNEASTAE